MKRETKQAKDLRKYTQLWLSADEWMEPLAVVEPPPENPFQKRRIVAWVVDRR